VIWPKTLDPKFIYDIINVGLLTIIPQIQKLLFFLSCQTLNRNIGTSMNIVWLGKTNITFNLALLLNSKNSGHFSVNYIGKRNIRDISYLFSKSFPLVLRLVERCSSSSSTCEDRAPLTSVCLKLCMRFKGCIKQHDCIPKYTCW
jgi:hypothetical protein